ncbi:hypothetical protein GCM10009738_42990 [Kitasatospora viridis]|uniref:Uncharacterized protein n=1 Tax=Kitasatospora viridis TaxID=281105 RepID=A0A561TWJ6_9ACTN|nr:hypothetical protein FHX73_12601 [Kitasatospora viridis]
MSSTGGSRGRLGCGSRVLAAFDKAGRPHAGVAARVAARLITEREPDGDGRQQKEGHEDR